MRRADESYRGSCRQKSRRSKKKAAIRFALMAAIKEARGKLGLRKRERPNFIYARSLRRINPAIPIRPVDSSSRLTGSGVDSPGPPSAIFHSEVRSLKLVCSLTEGMPVGAEAVIFQSYMIFPNGGPLSRVFPFAAELLFATNNMDVGVAVPLLLVNRVLAAP
jgi:hypothetical protein